MSMEQNEPQVSQGQQVPPPPAPSALSESTLGAGQNGHGANPAIASGGNQGQQRRRRRRRKGGKGAGANAGAAAAAAGEPVIPPAPAAPSADIPPGQFSAQNREQFPAPSRNGLAGDAPRDQNGRQARSYQQNQHKKQQQRQNKGGGSVSSGGGSSQGRQFQKGPQAGPREYNPGNGGPPPGNGGNGGMRRKNKVRRQAPSFVGPMDHSYRTANGNVADGPPSTMDFRGGGMPNGNVNGNVYGRNGYGDGSEYVAPIVLREDAPTKILCFIEDLFVVAKLQETARKLGVKVSFAKGDKDVVTRLSETPEAERPSLIVFDLNNANAKPLTLIPKLKAKLKRGTSVIGFLSHIQGDLKVKAIEAGCDMVMPKSAFSQNLPNLLRRHGLDEEELEAFEA